MLLLHDFSLVSSPPPPTGTPLSNSVPPAVLVWWVTLLFLLYGALLRFGFSFTACRQGWKPGEEPDVAAAIMGLFHLLPHSPKFLDQLVKLTLQLEAVLHRLGSSGESPSIPVLQGSFTKRGRSSAFQTQHGYLVLRAAGPVCRSLLKRG